MLDKPAPLGFTAQVQHIHHLPSLISFLGDDGIHRRCQALFACVLKSGQEPVTEFGDDVSVLHFSAPSSVIAD